MVLYKSGKQTRFSTTLTFILIRLRKGVRIDDKKQRHDVGVIIHRYRPQFCFPSPHYKVSHPRLYHDVKLLQYICWGIRERIGLSSSPLIHLICGSTAPIKFGGSGVSDSQ